MRYLVSAVFFAVMTSTANAQCFGTEAFQTCTDFQSGNTYQIQRFGNTTQMYGSNPRTGSTWSQTTNKIGNTTYQNGFDSSGNSWNTTRQDFGNGNFNVYGTDSSGNFVNKSCFNGICY